jgi:glycerol-3-phosphate dehydrogenase (NAD(P)+)
MASNGHGVVLWTRDARRRDEINEAHTNARAVSDLILSPRIRAVTELKDALTGADLIVFVVPSQAFRSVCRAAGDFLLPDQLVVHATKGLEQGSHCRMTEILLEETCVRQIGVLAGPNIAREIAAGKPSGTVLASRFPRLVEVGRRALSSPRLMVFSGDDVIGVEVASAFKNIVAIAAGMAIEMHLGENAKALLMARGFTEMVRLGGALGARPATFTGLAGIGDLVVTCSSSDSRNNRVGRALARGEELPDILARLGMVAEGVPASVSAHELASTHGIETPVLDQVYRVLYEGASPQKSLEALMALTAGPDVTSMWRRP